MLKLMAAWKKPTVTRVNSEGVTPNEIMPGREGQTMRDTTY